MEFEDIREQGSPARSLKEAPYGQASTTRYTRPRRRQRPKGRPYSYKYVSYPYSLDGLYRSLGIKFLVIYLERIVVILRIKRSLSKGLRRYSQPSERRGGGYSGRLGEVNTRVLLGQVTAGIVRYNYDQDSEFFRRIRGERPFRRTNSFPS